MYQGYAIVYNKEGRECKFSNSALANRNIIRATGVILKLLVATLKKTHTHTKKHSYKYWVVQKVHSGFW